MIAVSRPVVQVALVVAIVAGFTLVIDAANYRSGWNLLWMIGIPVIVAKGFDQGEGAWPLGALWLSICSLGAMVLTAALFGLSF